MDVKQQHFPTFLCSRPEKPDVLIVFSLTCSILAINKWTNLLNDGYEINQNLFHKCSRLWTTQTMFPLQE